MQEGSSDRLERSTTKTARPVLIWSQNRRVSRLANHRLGLYLHPPFRRLLLADDSISINRLRLRPEEGAREFSPGLNGGKLGAVWDVLAPTNGLLARSLLVAVAKR